MAEALNQTLWANIKVMSAPIKLSHWTPPRPRLKRWNWWHCTNMYDRHLAGTIYGQRSSAYVIYGPSYLADITVGAFLSLAFLSSSLENSLV